MGVPHITTFCWCMGLEMGSKVVGLVHLILSSLLIIMCSVYAENFRAYIGTVEDAGDHLYSTYYKIAVVVAVVSVVHVMLAGTLLVGVAVRNTCCLRVWVVVMSVVYVAVLAYIAVITVLTGFTASGSDIFLAFLEAVLFFGILAYCILCVNSFYLLLKSTEDVERSHGADASTKLRG